jgi:hypothetical protein
MHGIYCQQPPKKLTDRNIVYEDGSQFPLLISDEFRFSMHIN